MIPPAPREVAPDEVLSQIESGAKMHLVDVRQPEEYERYHIPGAVLMPLGELTRRFAAELDPADSILCICEHGVRSRHAAAFLVAQGYPHAATMTGGMAEYPGPTEVGFPDEVGFPESNPNATDSA